MLPVVIRGGALELDVFGLGLAGVTLVDSRKQAVVVSQGGVGKPDPQGILGICQLLGDVTGVGPGEVGVGPGGIGGVSVVGGRRTVVPVLGQQ